MSIDMHRFVYISTAGYNVTDKTNLVFKSLQDQSRHMLKTTKLLGSHFNNLFMLK